MSNIAIKVENLSKAYQLGEIGTGTISRDLERWFARIRGKEDPFLQIGEANDRTSKGTSDIVWSLRDINFEIEQGDTVGIIGRNGAGKSTLLKILSKVTAPTTGRIRGKGRIASLLEVGTGFHPELTGRENIFLNGAILGMRKQEINKHFDAIVDFAGIARYIDTPVKRYSSGMYVRLAFAVAAHLESEILIVDEVLAVGDAEFQKKCLGKMGEVSKGEGRTVLFVSHNMGSINSLCRSLLILNNGTVSFSGNTEQGLKKYLVSAANFDNLETTIKNMGSKRDDTFRFTNLEIKQNESSNLEFLSDKPIDVIISYEIKHDVSGLRVGFDLIHTATESVVFRTFHDDSDEELSITTPGLYTSKVRISGDFLKDGEYFIDMVVGIHNVRWIIYKEFQVRIGISNINGINKLYADERPGIILPKVHWHTKQLN